MPTAADLIDCLRSSDLLDPAQLDEISAELVSDDPQELVNRLLDRNLLTQFQVDHLLKGRGGELVLGPYRLLELLGEGGMGQVYKAKHRRLQRIVALKVIRRERLSQDPEIIHRFQREAQAAAQLFHPNVVIIYDADQIDGTHFIAMEYVDGIDLARLVFDRGPLPIEQACDYIRQTALGLQHAFEQQLVHRDIKPSNLLVSRLPKATESIPDYGANRWGIVKILDMGLARLVQGMDGQAASFLTQVGTIIGTPDFIAPEQARNSSKVDIRADLYSVGCTFYFLLTGQPPFTEGSVVEKLLMHQLDEPEPVTKLRPEVPEAVAAIIHKLMSKRPEDRFQEPRHLVDALAAVADTLKATATSAVTDSPAAACENGAPPPNADMENTAVVEVTPLPADPTNAQAVKQEKAEEALVPVAGMHVESAEKPKRIAELHGHRGWVLALAFSPDRNRLASAGIDGTICLWGFSSRLPSEQRLPLAHDGEVHAVCFSPDSKLLASASGTIDGKILLWNLEGDYPRQLACLEGHMASVECLAFDPTGQYLASGSSDKTIRVWDLSPQEFNAKIKATYVLKGHTDAVLALTFGEDFRTVLSGGRDGTIRTWNLGRLWGAKSTILQGQSGEICSLCMSGDRRFLASSSVDETVRIWDLPNQQSALLTGHSDVVQKLLFPPEGNRLLSVGNRGQIILWDLETTEKMREWNLGMLVNSAAITHDGRYVAIGKGDGSTAVFRLYPKRKKTDDSN
ncbi:MAG: hypothetical protein KatS3mg105_1199 [Gemmatales bacterium]|nr:MAG: hypothetical protein KatS3mg105_1199 [Gemmatales bacterium]